MDMNYFRHVSVETYKLLISVISMEFYMTDTQQVHFTYYFVKDTPLAQNLIKTMRYP